MSSSPDSRPTPPPGVEGTPSRSQAVLLAGYGIRLVVALALTSILGRGLGPDAFGFFTLVGTTLILAQILFDFGSTTIVVREVAIEPRRERALIEAMIGWRFLAALPVAGGMLLWAILESDPQRRTVLVAAAGVLPLLAPGALMAAFRVRQSHERPELVGIVTHTLVLVASPILLQLGLGGALFALLPVARALLTATGIGWLGTRMLGYLPRPGLRHRGWRPVLSMAAVQAAVLAVQLTYFYADVLLVGWVRGEAELGAYAAAFRPLNPLLTLPSLLMVPLLPVLARMARFDRTGLVRQLRSAVAVLLGFAGLAVAAGTVLAPELVQLLYGGRYSFSTLNAAPALLWLSIAFGLVLTVSIFQTALLADGQEGLLLRFALVGLVINVIGNLALLPHWGFTAAAFVTALTNAIVGGAVLVSTRTRLGTGLFAPTQILALLPGVVLAAILWLLPGEPIVRVAVGGLLGLAGVILVISLPGARRLRLELARDAAASKDLGRGWTPW